MLDISCTFASYIDYSYSQLFCRSGTFSPSHASLCTVYLSTYKFFYMHIFMHKKAKIFST